MPKPLTREKFDAWFVGFMEELRNPPQPHPLIVSPSREKRVREFLENEESPDA